MKNRFLNDYIVSLELVIESANKQGKSYLGNN